MYIYGAVGLGLGRYKRVLSVLSMLVHSPLTRTAWAGGPIGPSLPSQTGCCAECTERVRELPGWKIGLSLSLSRLAKGQNKEEKR